MTARNAVATLCVIGALAGVPGYAAAQTAPSSSTAGHATVVAGAPAAQPDRGGGVRLDARSPQSEPLFLALFGAAAIGLGLFLRRHVAH
jgi:hypothetical protein